MIVFSSFQEIDPIKTEWEVLDLRKDWKAGVIAILMGVLIGGVLVAINSIVNVELPGVNLQDPQIVLARYALALVVALLFFGFGFYRLSDLDPKVSLTRTSLIDHRTGLEITWDNIEKPRLEVFRFDGAITSATLVVDVADEGMTKFWKINVSGFQLSPKEIKKKVQERIDRALESDG